MKFQDYAAYKKLLEESKNLPDMTAKGFLSLERVKKCQIAFNRLRFYWGTERVSDSTRDALVHLAKEADVWEKMFFMQNMEIMNYVNNSESEKRRVGHTALRFVKPGNEWSATMKQMSKEYQLELDKLRALYAKHGHKYKSMIVVGIGGSYLGTKAIYEALRAYQNNEGKRLYFSSNVDPDRALAILEMCDMKSTLVVIVSKSGSTLEIRTQEEFFRQKYERAGLNPKEHFLVVTTKHSPMDKPGRYLETFYMDESIGGRYSVTSMVGAVPLTFIYGISLWEEFLRGAHDMDMHALKEKDPLKNIPLWSALLDVWNRNFLKSTALAIIPYSQAMSSWDSHLQQLFMESNGKSVSKDDGSFISWETCPVIFGTPGTEGQHSYFQCLHQGTDRVPLEFISFASCQRAGDLIIEGTNGQEKLLSNMIAQSIAFATGDKNPNSNKFFSGNRPSRIIALEKLDPYNLGLLLSYYENRVVFAGFLWGINSFDQEGVQLGKKLANDIIDLYKQKREKGVFTKTKNTEVAAYLIEEISSLSESTRGHFQKVG